MLLTFTMKQLEINLSCLASDRYQHKIEAKCVSQINNIFFVFNSWLINDLIELHWFIYITSGVQGDSERIPGRFICDHFLQMNRVIIRCIFSFLSIGRELTR